MAAVYQCDADLAQCLAGVALVPRRKGLAGHDDQMVAADAITGCVRAERGGDGGQHCDAQQAADDAGLRPSAVESDHPLIGLMPNTLASGALPSTSACVGPS